MPPYNCCHRGREKPPLSPKAIGEGDRRRRWTINCHSEPVRTLAWESHEITVEIATGRSGPRNDKIGTFLPARGTGQSDSADYTRYIFTKE